MRGLFWFRNDLRLHDNPALAQLAEQCDQLLCVYVIDEHWFELTRFQSKPLGVIRWQFICEALRDLRRSLTEKGQILLIRSGRPEHIIADLIDTYNIDVIGITRLPATYERQQVAYLLKRYPAKQWLIEDSFTLFRQENLPFTLEGLPDQFTHFRELVEAVPVPGITSAPRYLPTPLDVNAVSVNLVEVFKPPENPDLLMPFKGGEVAGLAQLHYYLHETGLVSGYKATRNGLEGWDFSSKLSPWLAQGCVSPRRVFAELQAYEWQSGANESTYWLYFELLWREFFQWLLYKHGSRLFHLRGTRRVNPLLTFYPEAFMAWKQGTTETDFVNALMRQLQLTGWMSNRGRQIVASYLVNELGVDWRFGAAWFEEQLIDYDPASNWGNWQYLAGVGTDPRGKRAFNIAKQQAQYDPEQNFINKYLAIRNQ